MNRKLLQKYGYPPNEKLQESMALQEIERLKGKSAITEYFATKKDVVDWWAEESWHPVLKRYFTEQTEYIDRAWIGKKVLDVGCGYGRYSRMIAARGGSVTGVDINQWIIYKALEYMRGYDISFVVGNAESLKFDDESFDAVICLETLMHLPNPVKAISEAHRVLKPGGLYITGINNKWALPYLIWEAQFYVPIYKRLAHQPPLIRWTTSVSNFRFILDACGFKINQDKGIGLLHPEVNVCLPRKTVNIIPYELADKALDFEKRHGLEHGVLKHIMKAYVVEAVKI